jgi:hypothetical protein
LSERPIAADLLARELAALTQLKLLVKILILNNKDVMEQSLCALVTTDPGFYRSTPCLGSKAPFSTLRRLLLVLPDSRTFLVSVSMSQTCRYCCKSRKSNNPKNLAKVDLRTSLLLRRLSAPLQRSVIDFG